ncbi:MAG: hypothetical protein AB7U76_24450 [Pirellulales bacterium]
MRAVERALVGLAGVTLALVVLFLAALGRPGALVWVLLAPGAVQPVVRPTVEALVKVGLVKVGLVAAVARVVLRSSFRTIGIGGLPFPKPCAKTPSPRSTPPSKN